MTKPCNKSVSNPSAQYTNLCDVGKQETLVLTKAKALIDLYISTSPVLSYLIALQMFYGLRISEVLGISSGDILFNGSIALRTLKNGENRIITPTIGLDYFVRCRSSGIKPFQDYNRFWIYRLYKAHNIILDNGFNNKKSVTHSFRHINTTLLRRDDVDKDIIKKSLGHKSEKTQIHYGRNKKRSD